MNEEEERGTKVAMKLGCIFGGRTLYSRCSQGNSTTLPDTASFYRGLQSNAKIAQYQSIVFEVHQIEIGNCERVRHSLKES